MSFQCCPSWMTGSSHASVHDPRQPDRKGRALTRLACHRNVTTHHLAETLANREPEAGAAVFAGGRGIGLGEFLEQFVHLLGRHADAGVGDRERDPVAAISPVSGERRW